MFLSIFNTTKSKKFSVKAFRVSSIRIGTNYIEFTIYKKKKNKSKKIAALKKPPRGPSAETAF